jgi:hypothetical protein
MAVASKIVASAKSVDRDALEQERRARVVQAPVGWLLGPELLGQLKKILRRRSDPRDWMPYYRGCVHDECWGRDGRLVRVIEPPAPGDVPVQPDGTPVSHNRAQSAERTIKVDKPAMKPAWKPVLRTVAEPTAEPTPPGSEPELEPAEDVWFDYLADMGDSVDSMYAIAYATMVSFDGDDARATWPEGDTRKPLTVVAGDAAGTLPRGQFLFVGGDTAYHVADGPTLRARVERPFRWAFTDAQANGHLAEHADLHDHSHRIYGIPGNHDWYDNVQGFAQVFRLGSSSTSRTESKDAPIQLPEIERVQLASYVAIQLPHGWQLWGLDIDGGLDARQLAYFESLRPLPAQLPERLILATPSPAIAFGAVIPDDKHRKALEDLKIPLPAVPLAPGAAPTPRYRLDLSGDVHHYARYYPRDRIATYGSVVSGLGGAFHHPSFTRASSTKQRVEPVREYPTCPESRTRIADNMLTWMSAWFGSWARVIPFVLTMVCGFAATYSRGGAWLLDRLFSVLPGFTPAPSPDGSLQLMRSLCTLSVFLLALGGGVAAVLFARSVRRKQVRSPGAAQSVLDVLRRPGWFKRLFALRRSYWFAWLIAIVLIAPFVLHPLWGEKSETLRLDIATIVIVFALPLAGGFVGWFYAAKYLAGWRKPGLFAVGLVHAAGDVITAIVFARMFTLNWLTAVAGVGTFAVAASMLHVARPLFKRQSRWSIALLIALALVVFTLAIALVVVAAGGETVKAAPHHWYWDTLRFLASALVAMPIGTTWFVWYLAVCGRLDAHNNEVGGAARVTSYRELIRFHVHRGGLTGYVIAVETDSSQPAGDGGDRMNALSRVLAAIGLTAYRERTAANAGGTNLRFHLIDVFTIEAPATASHVHLSRPSATELEGSAVG